MRKTIVQSQPVPFIVFALLYFILLLVTTLTQDWSGLLSLIVWLFFMPASKIEASSEGKRVLLFYIRPLAYALRKRKTWIKCIQLQYDKNGRILTRQTMWIL